MINAKTGPTHPLLWNREPTPIHQAAVKAVRTTCRVLTGFFSSTGRLKTSRRAVFIYFCLFFLQFKAGDESKVAAASAATCACVCLEVSFTPSEPEAASTFTLNPSDTRLRLVFSSLPQTRKHRRSGGRERERGAGGQSPSPGGENTPKALKWQRLLKFTSPSLPRDDGTLGVAAGGGGM